MSPTPLLKRDWLLGLLVVGALVVAYWAGAGATLDGRLGDAAMRAVDRTPSDRIAIIAIDDASLANLGRWPWSRDVHARFHERLAQGAPKVVANLTLFAEPERDRAAATIDRLSAAYRELVPADAPAPAGALGRIGSILAEAARTLDTDRDLATSLAAAGNVVLPIVFRLDAAAASGAPDRALPDWLERSTVRPAGSVPDRAQLPLTALEFVARPIDAIGRAAALVGHLNATADADGVYRTDPLVVSYYGHVFPSLALAIATRALNLAPANLGLDYGAPLALGGRKVPTGEHVVVQPHFHRAKFGRLAFPVDSYFDVASGKVPAEKFRDKVVLVGPTAAGLAAFVATPVDAAAAPVVVLANQVSALLEGHVIATPGWSGALTLAAFVAVALYLAFGLGRLSALAGALTSAALLVVLLAVPFVAMAQALLRLELALPAAALVLGHLVFTTRGFLASEAGKLEADAGQAESNRMLALAFQGQGQLDLAFDKLRRVPVNPVVADNLYGLALDFERKRQFNKAEEAFKHIAATLPDYRDVASRIARARSLADTVILGTSAGTVAAPTLDGGVEKPLLGRYRLERELGRGAMGAVYLGVDPKIGRQVAVKTVALAREFAGDELEEARTRFFREAETAGRLAHPDIVTIYDAGEDQDLAYIAMELVQGHDLARHIGQADLLPLNQLVPIIVRVANALDYAHRQNVVHRDIKPGNIMIELAAGSVKVTDFGIARITDASRTRTGIVLGTPSYMSPEQLAGKHVDGRSDLFSLGVTFYQLASGRLPFSAETMAGLMYKITNEPAPDLASVAPAVPAAIADVIARVLAKDPAHRPASGRELAQALTDAATAATVPSQPSPRPALVH